MNARRVNDIRGLPHLTLKAPIDRRGGTWSNTASPSGLAFATAAISLAQGNDLLIFSLWK
jgi:hypothetical protein